jgi:phosphoserine phosphatase
MKKKIALLDWDGSITKDFTIRMWVRFLSVHGVISKEANKDISKLFNLFYKGKISHDRLALETAQIYCMYLKGHRRKIIEELASRYVLESLKYLHFFSLLLFEKLEEKNIQIIVVSGAPVEILNKYKEKFSIIRQVFGLKLKAMNGSYTGDIELNPGVMETKQYIVRQVTEYMDNKVILAVGNSESDIPLFKASSLSMVVDNPRLKLDSRVFYISSKKNSFLEFLNVLDKEVSQ